MFFKKELQQKPQNTCVICGYYYDNHYEEIKCVCKKCNEKIEHEKKMLGGEMPINLLKSQNQQKLLLEINKYKNKVGEFFYQNPTEKGAIYLFATFWHIGVHVGEFLYEYSFETEEYEDTLIEEAQKIIEDILLKNAPSKYKDLPQTGFDKCFICTDETQGSPFCEYCLKIHSKIQLLDILNNKLAPKSIAELESSQEEIENNCFLCRKKTNSIFCSECIEKYSGKNLAIIISDLRDVKRIQEVDKHFSFAIYKCKDGHMVRSKSEMAIDNFLFDHKVRHVYEKDLTVNGITIHPDFYLPDLDVYIEHLGYKGYKKYDDQTEFKKALYDKKVIYTKEDDIPKLEEVLIQKLTTPPKRVRFTKLPTEGFNQCILCNTRTNGYAFCRSCWQEYNDEDLLRILNQRFS